MRGKNTFGVAFVKDGSLRGTIGLKRTECRTTNILVKCPYCRAVTLCTKDENFGWICEQCYTVEKYLLTTRIEMALLKKGDTKRAAIYTDKAHYLRMMVEYHAAI